MGRSIVSVGDPKGVQGGNEGKTQGGLPLGNPVCLWQTELFKLNLKSSPSSSGYNRRRRLAPRSSGKQQTERTSVRAAPIVCPEESPLLAATHDNFVIRETITGGLTRRLRRELGLVILWASRRLSVPEGFQRASGKPFGAPAGAYLLLRGADAPTTARTVGLPHRGGPVLSFEAKESTKESQRHGDSCGPPRYA